MKKGSSFLLLLSFFLFATLQLYAKTESENFNNIKQDAEDAFAELEGRIPAPKTRPAPSTSSTETKKTGNKSVDAPGKSRENVILTDTELLSFAILKGTGVGKDEESAKLSALSELSNSIIVNVSSQVQMSQEEKDGKYSQSFKEDIKTRSNVFLKGVRFTKPTRTESGFETTAFMTEKDVINTITYLLKTIPSDIETLAPERFDDVLTSIYLAYSLLYAVSDSQVNERAKYINILNNLKAEIEKLATTGSIYFSVKTNVSGKVNIDGGEYPFNKKIHLKPGTYNFSLKADGYKALRGKISILKGDKKFVEAILIPEHMEKKKIYLRVESPVRMIDDIEKVLLDFGIVPTQDNNLPHSLVVVLKGTSTKVDNYEKYIIEIDVHTFKNGQKFKITHYEHKPFFVTNQNKNEKIREESKKISTAVIKKFLSSIDLYNFFGE